MANDQRIEALSYIANWVDGFNRATRYYYYEKDSRLPTYDEWEASHSSWKSGWMTGLRISKNLSGKGK